MRNKKENGKVEKRITKTEKIDKKKRNSIPFQYFGNENYETNRRARKATPRKSKKKENEKAGYIRRIQPALMEPKSKRSKITEPVV